MKARMDEIPAERLDADCDCTWHRRRFLHLWNGRINGADQRTPLSYQRIIVYNPIDDLILHRLRSVLLEGRYLQIFRSVRPGLGPPVYDAVITPDESLNCAWGLTRRNPQAVWTPQRADPTLIYELGPSRLVVWSEAWSYFPPAEPGGPDSLDGIDYPPMWPGDDPYGHMGRGDAT